MSESELVRENRELLERFKRNRSKREQMAQEAARRLAFVSGFLCGLSVGRRMR
jgi:hypothetical protein